MDDSIDEIAPGFILSSFTTVTLQPIFLLSDLFVDMFPTRKDTLRNSTEMMARYEKDDKIENALTIIYKDEYKDDRFFNDDGTFEFAKCFECGGPKIGHGKRNEKKCIYEEFLKGKSWSDEDLKDMENKIRKIKGFNDAMMILDRRINLKDDTLEVYMYDEKNPVEFLAPKIGSHLKMKMEGLKKWNLEETVNYLEEEVNIVSEEEKKKMTEHKNMKKIHEITNHKSAGNMIHAYANAEIVDDKVRKTARKVVDSC